MTQRYDRRNVAIIAHVDHGKTTLVDQMLWQSGAFSDHQAEKTGERIMDSGELEREKGITILAKNTAVHYSGKAAKDRGIDTDVVINVVDTPGHADFGGEVERALSMVDGALLLVDAAEGPRPQTRFVVSKALAAGLPIIVVINKVDRPDARTAEVEKETFDLLLSLAQDLVDDGHDVDLDSIIDAPVLYASAKKGRCSTVLPERGELPDGDLHDLFDAILSFIPGPTGDPDAPLQAHVTNLDASPFLGRLALLRIHNGTLTKGETVGWAKRDGTLTPVKITELLVTRGLDRNPAEQASAGDIVAVAGIDDITIGESLVDLDDPKPLPLITVDEPAIALTIGVNTSPLAGRVKGAKVTARQVKDRLDKELIGNVSLRVLPTDRPDTWEVQGRGELALAILVEQMRREGFELTVGSPQAVLKEIDGTLNEPMEALTIDIPEEYMGDITQLMAARKGQMDSLVNHGTGWVRLEYTVPARGLIGFRTRFLTVTRGTGIAASVAAGYAPYKGDIQRRSTGSLVCDRAGTARPYAMIQLQERGTFIVDPGSDVYEGQVVGENPRLEDMDVNITREKKQTNVRAASADNWEGLIPPRHLTLEESLEFAAIDESVEVTPKAIRIRKNILDQHDRKKAQSRQRKMNS